MWLKFQIYQRSKKCLPIDPVYSALIGVILFIKFHPYIVLYVQRASRSSFFKMILNELSSDSYTGRDGFFFRKSFEICSGYFFAVWLLISCKILLIDFFKGRQTPLSNSKQKYTGHEKRDRLLALKVDYIFQTPSEIKILPIDSVFSNWVNFIKMYKP